MDFDVIVIGAGAAGMMCAATAGQRGRRVLLLDHAAKLGEKIRISGGGRCNFTNLHSRPEAFVSRNPDFCRSALARYTPRHFIELVERHGIRYHEKTLGQLFCDDNSQQIIDLLRRECDEAGVRWAMPLRVAGVTRRRTDPGNGACFQVATSRGSFRCVSLVIASGGLSIPKIGASPFGYRIAEQFGLAVVPPKPALVPLVGLPEWIGRFGDLAGASFDAVTACPEAVARFREAVLLTHRGLSGPAILQISTYWQQAGAHGAVEIDLVPELDAGAWLAQRRHDRSSVGILLAQRLPRRFAQRWAEAHGWTEPLARFSNKMCAMVALELKRWRFVPGGTLGYEKAEVTLGGIDTGALSQQTMEARAVPGLYFIGEVVDVTGWLGGYNFQWAWSSGHAAGLAA